MNCYCDICWVEFNSQSSKEIHLNSNGHIISELFQKKLKLNSDVVDVMLKYYCDVCSIQTDTQDVLNVHLNSKNHKSKLENKKKILKSNNKMYKDVDDENNPLLEATSFNKNLKLDLAYSSTYDFKSLENTKTDNKNMTHSLSVQNIFEINNNDQNSLIGRFFCEFCQVSSTSKIVFDTHLNSKIHKSKIESNPEKVEFIQNDQGLEEHYKSSNWCHCCYSKYSSDVDKEIHLNGSQHKKRFEIKEIILKKEHVNKNNYCCICFCILDGDEQKNVHYNSRVHSNQQKKYEEYTRMNSSLTSTKLSSSDSSGSIKSMLNDDSKSSERNSIYSKILSSSSSSDSIVDLIDNPKIRKYLEKTNQNDNILNDHFQQIEINSNNAMSKHGVRIFKYTNPVKKNQISITDSNPSGILASLEIDLEDIYNRLVAVNYL